MGMERRRLSCAEADGATQVERAADAGTVKRVRAVAAGAVQVETAAVAAAVNRRIAFAAGATHVAEAAVASVVTGGIGPTNHRRGTTGRPRLGPA